MSGRDYTLNPDSSIATWSQKRYVQPTSAQLATANAQIAAAQQKLAADVVILTKLKSDLIAAFAGWPVGDQYAFAGVKAAIAEDLATGNVAPRHFWRYDLSQSRCCP